MAERQNGPSGNQPMSMRFDLFDLQLFIHVTETHSLTRGAEKSCISLAAASARIKQMEESIGTKLLLRSAQGTTETEAGKALLYHARRVMQQIEHLRCDMQDYAKGVVGHVRIFANTTSITEYLPEALAGFLAAHPGVGVDLRECLSEDIVRAVVAGEADIGIVAGDVRTDDLVVRPYGRNQLVAVTSSRHPLATREAVGFGELLVEHHVSLQAHSAIHAFLSRTAESIGGQYRPRVQVGSFEAMCRMIEAGVGVGVLPLSSARRHARSMDIRVIPLSEPWAERRLELVARNPQALPVFARELFEHLAASRR